MLQIQNLTVNQNRRVLLSSLNLKLGYGENHYIIGPNGAGKSTLGLAILGLSNLKVQGSIIYQASLKTPPLKLNELKTEDRANLGIYLGFQYPPAIPGVTIAQFLHLAKNARNTCLKAPALPFAAFLEDILLPATKQLDLPWEFVGRFVHDGLSGGEQKRLLLLEMLVLEPNLLIWDELDSGLDQKGVKLAVKVLHLLRQKNPHLSLLIISHQKTWAQQIPPSKVHVLIEGEIVQSGGAKLLDQPLGL